MVTGGKREGSRGLRDKSYYVKNKQATRIYCTQEIIIFHNNYKCSITFKNSESLCCIDETCNTIN